MSRTLNPDSRGRRMPRVVPARFVFTVVSALAVAGPTCPRGFADSPPARPADFRTAADEAIALTRQLRDAVQAPGMAVAVVIGDSIMLSRGFGVADLEGQVPIGSSTRFRLGSVSKVVTAATLARLLEVGQIDLDAPIERYLDEVPVSWRPITARMLAGHRAGIRNYEDKDFVEGSNIDRRHFQTTRAALDIFRQDPLNSSPGSAYHYSTFGYTLLSAVIEGAAGRGFEDLVRATVFDPLEMTNSGFDRGNGRPPEHSGYFVREAGEIVGAPQIDPSYKLAGGGMLSTASDLARFARAHLQDGFLPDSTRSLLFRTQTLPGGGETGVGLGWRSRDPDGGFGRLVFHAGSISGGRAVILLYPDQRVGVVLLSNLSLAPVSVEASAQVIAQPFLDAIEGRNRTSIAPVGDYRYSLSRGAVEGGARLHPSDASGIGVLETPGSLRARGARFGIEFGDSIRIIRLYTDDSGSRASLVFATPLGFYRADGRWVENSFTGDVSTLYPAGFEGTLTLSRVNP